MFYFTCDRSFTDHIPSRPFPGQALPTSRPTVSRRYREGMRRGLRGIKVPHLHTTSLVVAYVAPRRQRRRSLNPNYTPTHECYQFLTALPRPAARCCLALTTRDSVATTWPDEWRRCPSFTEQRIVRRTVECKTRKPCYSSGNRAMPQLLSIPSVQAVVCFVWY